MKLEELFEREDINEVQAEILKRFQLKLKQLTNPKLKDALERKMNDMMAKYSDVEQGDVATKRQIITKAKEIVHAM